MSTTSESKKHAFTARVLICIGNFSATSGGAQRAIAHQLAAADHDRFEYHVAYFFGDGSLAGDLPDAVTVHALDAKSQVDPRNLQALRKLVGDGGFDIVHSQSPFTGPLVRLAARSLPADSRPAVIATEQNVHTRVTGLPGMLNGATLGLADVITNVSDAVHDSYFGWERPLLRSADIRTVHNAVPAVEVDDRAAARQTILDRHGLGDAPDDLVLVGNVARIDPQKGQRHLIEAMARLDEALRAKLHLLIVGNGLDSPLGVELQDAAQTLGVSDAVTFTGPVTDVATYLSGIDVFAMPSLHEGFSLAILEAMSAGLPVLATRIDPLVEALDAAAVYVSPEPNDIAKGLTALAEDPAERERLGALAQKRHGELFTDVAMARQYEDLYAELMTRRVSSSNGSASTQGRDE